MSSGEKSLRLRFKGDKPTKKKKRKVSDKNKDEYNDEGSDAEQYGGDEQAWVPAVQPMDLTGPTFLFQRASLGDTPSAPAAHSLSVNPTMQRVEAAPISRSDLSLALTGADAPPELEGAAIADDIVADVTPQSVMHVWVATHVIDTYDPPLFTFRSAEGKFLRADAHGGGIEARSEARGPQEQWEVLSAPGDVEGIVLRSFNGMYLSLDEIAGGRFVVRADTTEPSHAEVWQARVQWKYRHEARLREQARKQPGGGSSTKHSRSERGNPRGVEDAALSKSRSAGVFVDTSGALTHDDRRMLKRAQRQGRVNEEMLDRRARLKSDRYAK